MSTTFNINNCFIEIKNEKEYILFQFIDTDLFEIYETKIYFNQNYMSPIFNIKNINGIYDILVKMMDNNNTIQFLYIHNNKIKIMIDYNIPLFNNSITTLKITYSLNKKIDKNNYYIISKYKYILLRIKNINFFSSISDNILHNILKYHKVSFHFLNQFVDFESIQQLKSYCSNEHINSIFLKENMNKFDEEYLIILSQNKAISKTLFIDIYHYIKDKLINFNHNIILKNLLENEHLDFLLEDYFYIGFTENDILSVLPSTNSTKIMSFITLLKNNIDLKNYDWINVCNNPYLTFDFILSFIEYIKPIQQCLINLCKNENLSINNIKDISKNIPIEGWKNIYSHNNINITFLSNNKTKIIYQLYCSNKYVSTKFLEHNIDKIDWKILCKNEYVSHNFFMKYIDIIPNNCFQILCSNNNIPMSFFEKYIDNIDNEGYSNICSNNNITIDFIEKNIDKLNEECWSVLCSNKNIPFYFFIKYNFKLNNYCYELLSLNKNISYNFILEKYV